jgi:hypothetical protein
MMMAMMQAEPHVTGVVAAGSMTSTVAGPSTRGKLSAPA